MISFKLTTIAAASLFSPISAFNSNDVVPRNFAHQLSDDIVQQFNVNNNKAGRHLQTLSRSEFADQICEPYKSGFLSEAPDGAECSCSSPTKYAVTCVTPKTCEGAAPSGCNAIVCLEVSSTTTEFSISNNYASVNSIEFDFRYSGTEYSGERIVVGQDGCDVFYSIGDLEYKCSSCSTACAGDDISLDCSNIQPQASTVGCQNPESQASELGSVMLCPENGAPVPSTAGTPVSAIASGANLMATLKMFLLSTGVGCACLLTLV